MDETRLKAQKLAGYISPPTAWVLWIIACFFGFLIGWYANENPESKGTCLIIAICFAIASSWPMKFWSSWLQGRQAMIAQMGIDEQREQLKEEAKRSREQLKEEAKRKKEETKKAKPTKSTERTNGFSDEDSDNDAKRMLLEPVKKARKANAKVTGQGLVETFLKGLK